MNNQKLLQNVLSKDAFWMVNKKIALEVGLNGAVMLADLLSKEQYFMNKNQLTAEGYFFNTTDNIEEDTGLGSHERLAAQKELVRKGWISIVKRDIPAKNYFSIDHNAIVAFLAVGQENGKSDDKSFDNRTPSGAETARLGDGKPHGNKNKGNKIKENKVAPSAQPSEKKPAEKEQSGSNSATGTDADTEFKKMFGLDSASTSASSPDSQTAGASELSFNEKLYQTWCDTYEGLFGMKYPSAEKGKELKLLNSVQRAFAQHVLEGTGKKMDTAELLVNIQDIFVIALSPHFQVWPVFKDKTIVSLHKNITKVLMRLSVAIKESKEEKTFEETNYTKGEWR